MRAVLRVAHEDGRDALTVAPPTSGALGLARRTVEALAASGLAVPVFVARLPAP